MAWPITTADVTAHIGVSPAGDADTAHLARCTAAAVEWVTSHVESPSGASIELGTIMLAARWYSRRNSPAGVASFSELGAAYVVRTDPDIGKLLGLSGPRVG